MSEELLKVMRGCGIWIPGRGAHVLRRTAAHLLARAGTSVVALQKIMGWNRIATAAAYLAEDKVEQGMALDKLGSRLVRGFDPDEEALKRRDEEWTPEDDLPEKD